MTMHDALTYAAYARTHRPVDRLDKLPINYNLAWQIADAAIDLLLECRDVHGQDEARARIEATRTVAESASTRTDPPAA